MRRRTKSAGPDVLPRPENAVIPIREAAREDAPAEGTPEGKTTLAAASRDRLARPIADRALWGEFEKATGEPVDPRAPPTWAELIAAQQARRAATSEGGTRDAKELREAAEGSKGDSARVAFLLSLDGLPRTNAVAGKTPA
ncbi:MAG TPA: hypothetical protein VNJ12_06655 [Candidatus Dormibacteraeota bacterium]|nr:hypothetical protein [Candidatus Dormibacteraeota bacterium]